MENLALPIVGFMMRNHIGLDFAGTNTAREAFDLPPMAAGDMYTVIFICSFPNCIHRRFPFHRPSRMERCTPIGPATGWTTRSCCR